MRVRLWFKDILTENLIAKPSASFEGLADLIASYPLITRNTHFVLVPGPLDMAINSLLPRRPLLSSLVSRLKTKVPHVHFATNPCRIKFFNQEIVIFREDMMARMLRSVVGVKPEVRNDDLKRFVSGSFLDVVFNRGLKLCHQLVQSILDQAHLSPFTSNIQPVLPDYDHTLRLYPLPTAVALSPIQLPHSC
jgi:DNA polymerase epsilon subunit 2